MAVLNVVSRLVSDLTAFQFAANETTTAALAVGSGPGGPPDGQPLFDSSAWFGFAATVDPFALPPLGADEILVLSFDLDLPASALPLSLEAQFAAGEGNLDGTPRFTGDHPTRYFGVDDPELFFAPEASADGLALATAALLVSVSRRSRAGRRGGSPVVNTEDEGSSTPRCGA